MWGDDLIMINTAASEPLVRQRDAKDHRRCPIYALIDNGEARVKRIERPSVDTMLLISDNPDYPPELRQGSDIQAVKIIGKVVPSQWHSFSEHLLLDRGMMGDGVIDIRAARQAVEALGYQGAHEVEITERDELSGQSAALHCAGGALELPDGRWYFDDALPAVLKAKFKQGKKAVKVLG